jgi:hypothetical protein
MEILVFHRASCFITLIITATTRPLSLARLIRSTSSNTVTLKLNLVKGKAIPVETWTDPEGSGG